jgi:hypothetical protein
MVKKNKIELGWTEIVLILLVGFFTAGMLNAGLMFLEDQSNSKVESYELSDEDFNKMITIFSTIEYNGGFCERLGLESNVIVEDLNGIPYGVPICVAGEE